MKKGFTLIELLAVIIILVSTVTLIAVNIEKNISDAYSFESETVIDTIENAALVYVDSNTMNDLDEYNVDVITIQDLIDDGLLTSNNVNGIDTDNKILIAKKDNNIKAKYIGSKTTKNVIFLNGFSEVTVIKNSSYVDANAYVAIPLVGLVDIVGNSISTSVLGTYEIEFTYENADTVIRKINVVSN